jgi:hypothetical protein
VPARGPAGAAVMGAAARVTSRGGDTGKVRPSAAVRDAGREAGRCDPAARAGGDIGGRGQVAVARELADRTGQHPPGRLGIREWQAGQVEEVPRSSTSCTLTLATSALSFRTAIRWPMRQSRVR